MGVYLKCKRDKKIEIIYRIKKNLSQIIQTIVNVINLLRILENYLAMDQQTCYYQPILKTDLFLLIIKNSTLHEYMNLKLEK